MNWNK